MSLDKDYLKDLFTDEVKGCLKSDGDPVGTAANAVSEHNTSNDAHNDIRLLVAGLTSRLNALADSDDTTLDQVSELVEYIKANRSLIEQVTTGKVSVNDIIDNLTTNVANRPLSASQGVALKALIDAITVPTKVSELQNDAGYLTQHQDISGKASKSDLTAHTGNNTVHVTAEEKAAWNGKSNFSGSYNDLSDKPTIPTVPTKVSAFTNDAGYLTQHQDISGKASKSDLTAHTGNNTLHIKADERTKWNAKAEVLNLISVSSQTQVNFTPAEIVQAVADGKILMGLGGVCTLLGYSINGESSDYVYVIRPFGDAYEALLVCIAADKSYTYNIVRLASGDDFSSHVENTLIHVTEAERTKWNAKSNFSGSYNDLKDKPTIPTVPTKVSAFTNDAGYLTQHQDISKKANTSDLTAHTGNSTVHVTAAEKAAWNKNALPSVSPSDSGKILMVNSSGVPAWTTITNAEGVSY